MRRRLFNILAMLSLVLCMVALVDRAVQRWYFHWFEALTWHNDGLNRITRGVAATTGSGFVVFSTYIFCKDSHEEPPGSHINYGAIPQRNWNPTRDTFFGVRALTSESGGS